MIARLKSSLPAHIIIEEDSSDLYIVDFTHFGGTVNLSNTKPDKPYVFLKNESNLPVYFDGFAHNALRWPNGQSCRQCECIMFPQSCNTNDWILVVEMKYVSSIENAFRAENDYPKGMINQILDTVRFFRHHGIIEENRRVDAIVSFPTLIEDFSASFFTGTLTIEDILLNHRIRIRATNYGEIISNKRIKI